MHPRATPGDIEWIDTYGFARVCGHHIDRETVLHIEQASDRRDDGRLTGAAKERIAAELTERLHEMSAQAWAAWNAAGRPVIRHHE
ncbi:MAG TPA: hypothetical protein H9881_07005 [Candidatus Stackebrandtia excrementipullorum]|nr:hypothetical protein [Candidatus Stackebrandtia excrementipullorum]